MSWRHGVSEAAARHPCPGAVAASTIRASPRPGARAAIAGPDRAVLVSSASAWEIATKHRLGRLSEARDVAGRPPHDLRRAGCSVLPISLDHALASGALPARTAHPQSGTWKTLDQPCTMRRRRMPENVGSRSLPAGRSEAGTSRGAPHRAGLRSGARNSVLRPPTLVRRATGGRANLVNERRRGDRPWFASPQARWPAVPNLAGPPPPGEPAGADRLRPSGRP
jgi:hypothetical protein